MEGREPERTQLLHEAKQSLTLPAVLDTSAKLAAQNLLFGLARIIAAFKQLHSAAKVSFHASPDFTITRSAERWASGFSYGGLLTIESAEREVVFPEVRPNTCGTIVGRLHANLTTDDLVNRIISVRSSLKDVNWDYGRRNHFVNIYRDVKTNEQIFIIHGCPAAIKSDSPGSPGLYIEKSPFWQSRSLAIQTPVGPLRVLVDKAANEYWQCFKEHEKTSKAARRRVAEEIFGAFTLLSNETHEGMLDKNSYILGCHAATDTESVYPLMTTLGSEAYLVSAAARRKSLFRAGTDDVIALLPHGTGYDLPAVGELVDVQLGPQGHRFYRFQATEGPQVVYKDFSHVPFGHRSDAIVRSWADQQEFIIDNLLKPLLFTKL